jgi:hypothetical protein
MANTTNFNWETPDDTDLVKDGAAAMRTLGNSIDTSFVDLKGGTTGQILSKASNTDLDYTWVTTDDANAIQNAIVDAKGDLIAASANDTPARLAVGANNSLLTADSSQATGLKYAGLWTTYTPTLTALTLGNGSVSGTYCQIADTTFFRVIITFGSTTAFTGRLDVSLPTTPSGYTTFDYMNALNMCWDNSASAIVASATNVYVASTGLGILTTVVSGTYPAALDVSANVPFLWASGDKIHVQGSYRNS